MADAELPSFEEPGTPLVRPWPVLAAGLAAVAAGSLGPMALDGAHAWALLTIAGLVAVGAALALRLPFADPAGKDRWERAGMLAAAAGGGGLGVLALGATWESLALPLQVLSALALLGAALVALPRGLAVAVVGLLLALHFGAIATAVVSVAPPTGRPLWISVQGNDPPTGQPPWLSGQLMSRFYQPYLSFIHLNNAYHFYAPEPGPVTLLWFRVEFADGKSKWVKLPDHDRARNGLTIRRWGGLSTNTGQVMPPPPLNTPEQQRQWEEMVERRNQAGFRLSESAVLHSAVWACAGPRSTVADCTQALWLAGPTPMAISPPIPPVIPPMAVGQYRVPSVQVRLLLSSLARYVARTTPHPDGADQPVTGVKVYRIEYTNGPVEMWRAGDDPRDPTLYQATYQGDFLPSGELKPSCFRVTFGAEGDPMQIEQDGLLYWQIPIFREPSDEDVPEVPGPGGRPPLLRGPLFNFVRIHAGDRGEASNP
jgi:hypothetical protein